MKKCPKCGIFKENHDFYSNIGRGDGLAGYCKPCLKTYSDKQKHNRYERYIKNWNAKNKNKVIASRIANSNRRLLLGKNPICEICESTKATQLHHSNYQQPLLIYKLCPRCHYELHKKLRKEKIREKTNLYA
jgi:hypothetical protein